MAGYDKPCCDLLSKNCIFDLINNYDQYGYNNILL